ncbi:MAG: lipid-binding SYLF domain-containing protein [Deltaproteobacteria bacterium]|nr:lipid-binding SYLF domain-containing protein [Deltaproteobacteria bacterium]
MKYGKKHSRMAVRLMVSLFLATVFLMSASPSGAAEDLKPQILVDQALVTLNNFTTRADMKWFTEHLKDTKGVFIVPQLLKAGFIFGGSGGRGVVLVRDEKTGKWSEPAFYSIGSVSFGLQIGGESSQLIMQIRTQRGLESLYGTSFKLGGDTSVALGPVGGGGSAKGVTADLVSFSLAQGAYAGLALDGSMVKVNDDFNEGYYGKSVRPTDILVEKDVSNPGAAKLREALAKASEGK